MPTPENVAGERCSSIRHKSCPEYRAEGPDGASVCPFLESAWVDYCAAASVRKYVPHSESLFSRCLGDQYRYCDAYLRQTEAAGAGPSLEAREDVVQGIRVPNWLFYAPNHLWLDVAEDGSCHVGVDGFLARILGRVERVTFVTQRGIDWASAVLLAAGVDVQVVFPNPLTVTAWNTNLRNDPESLTADPYRRGWLFEGAQPVCTGLIPGTEACKWIEREVERLGAFARERLVPGLPGASMADGGAFDPRFLEHLDREEKYQLLHEFCSPYAKRQS
ncbi:MAG TPA: hypothetical protein VG672_29485 [Bryobacteraceae bacterium]|nr:hypothetical protein [Bryobacteraceae bacterium]